MDFNHRGLWVLHNVNVFCSDNYFNDYSFHSFFSLISFIYEHKKYFIYKLQNMPLICKVFKYYKEALLLAYQYIYIIYISLK